MELAQPGQWNGSQPPEKAYIDLAVEGWQKWPEKPAVIDVNSDQVVTFRQLEEDVRSFAGSLQALGIKSRSKVQFYAKNCLASLIAQQAVLFCNATLFMFKPYKLMKSFEYNQQTEHTEVELVLTDAANYDALVHDLISSAGREGIGSCVRNVIILDDIVPQKSMNSENIKVILLHQLPRNDFVHPTDVRIREDVLIVSYTSGSTGVPKGVMHSHYSFVAGLCVTNSSPVRMNIESDRTLLLSALGFISSLLGVCGVLAYSSTLILASHAIDADLPIYVERYKVTVFVMLECPMRTLMDNAHRFPNRRQMLSSLERVVVAGSIFPEQLRKQVRAFFGDVPLMNIYAMTESAGIVAGCPPKPDFKMNVGFIAPHFEVKILDEKGRPVKVGQPGELLLRGPQITLGYWKRDSRGDFTDDGYFSTGDLVTVDAAGNLSIVGRKAHFIICLDGRVAPQEIEDVLLQHPAVAEVIVVPTPHPVVKEAPTAMVVIHRDYKQKHKDSLETLSQELISHVADHLCENKQLHGGVHFVDKLARTDNGKYARNEIMKQAIQMNSK